MATPWRQAAGEYFETTINCLSEDERAKRITDLASRGFEVIRIYKRDGRFSPDESGSNRRRYTGSHTDAAYGAVLRRKNEKYKE